LIFDELVTLSTL